MNERDLEQRHSEAEHIAEEAAALAREHFAHLARLEVETKGLQDYVSAADREVEALIRGALAARFPEDGFLGEETGGASAESLWVVDPIDGTTNFLRGVHHFGVSIAFVHRGRVEVGVIADVTKDALYSARRGHGARRSGVPIHTRDTTRLDASILMVGHSPKTGAEALLTVLRDAFARGLEFRRFGSASLGLCDVAAGRVEGFWQAHLNAWDVLAGLLLVEEAGGRVNDFLAADGLTRGNEVLAAAPGVAEALSELTGVELPAPPAA